MSFLITATGLLLGEELLTSNNCLTKITSGLGGVSRVIPKPLSPRRAWREVHVFDTLGIWVLQDLDEGLSLYIGFAFMHEKAPFNPASIFRGTLMLNGVSLEPEMKLRSLPLSGPVSFDRSIGNSFTAKHSGGYDELNLRRLSRGGGRRTSEPVLIYVIHVFRASPPAPSATAVAGS